MKYPVFITLMCAWCLLCFNNYIFAAIKEDATQAAAIEKLPKKEITDTSKQLVRVNYTEKPIVEIVNELAALLNINIIMPQDGKGLDKVFYESKLTYHFPEKITVKELWEIILVSLHTLGYMTIQQDDMIAIVAYPNQKEAARQPVSLYHDIPPEDLPSTDQIIRYIYHLRNLSLEMNSAGIKNILDSMLTSKTPSYQTIPQTNAIIITDKAVNIKSAMKIIAELDEGGLRDAIEVIPLYYASASLVEDLFNKSIFLEQPKKNGTVGAKPEEKQIPYFPQNTKVAKLERSNAIVIMGTTHSIDIVKDFIVKYIDRPLETGDSMLHVYDLAYLTADGFAKVLQNIVKGAQQKQQTKGAAETPGPQQYFEDVVVVAEITSEKAPLTPQTQITQLIKEAAVPAEKQQIRSGGNRLIIAARKNDWSRIKRLIDDLDKPQLQVAIEALILDFTIENDKFLGGQTRNKSGFHNSTENALNFQSAQLAPPVLTVGTDGVLPADALMANLLQLSGTPASNIASNATPGSFIVSFQDKDNLGVWSVLQMLNQYVTTNILAQPFLVLQNHQSGWVFTQENRYLQSETQGGTGQIARVNFEDVSAGITLDVKPHISDTGNISMQIIIQISRYITPAGNTSANNRVERVIRTNASIGNGEVLVLGGLTRDEEDIVINETPLLGQVPVLGWFFKSETKTKIKNHLMVLISPTIVKPNLKGGMDVFTENKMDEAKAFITEDLSHFERRDPITRWFFKPNFDCPYEAVDEYLNQSYYDKDEPEPTGAETQESEISEASGAFEEPSLRQGTSEQDTERSPQYAQTGACNNETAQEKIKQLVKNEENPLLFKQRKDQVILNT